MKAQATKTAVGIKVSHRRDSLDKGYLVISPDLRQIIDCRIYFPATKAYCCIWVTAGDWRSGSGSAGGYGYHKQSAAVAEAIRNAGYELSEGISGRGDDAIERALLAIAEAEGFPGCKVFTTHP